MKEEVYVDQHTPWIPNHLVFDVDIHVEADFLVWGIHTHEANKETTRAGVLWTVTKSALMANFLLQYFQHHSVTWEK